MFSLRSYHSGLNVITFQIRNLAMKARLDKAIEEDLSNLPISMRNKEKMVERYGVGKDPRLPGLNQVYQSILQRKEYLKTLQNKKLPRQVN
jgi:hypothetical protein